jgi:exonuclease III
MTYACFHSKQPNGSGCAIVIPTAQARSVKCVAHTWAMQKSCCYHQIRLFLKYRYTSRTQTPTTFFSKRKPWHLFCCYIAKARRSQWRIITGGDFNLRSQDKDLSSKSKSKIRWPDDTFFHLLNRHSFIDAWNFTRPNDPEYTQLTASVGTVMGINYTYYSQNFLANIRSVNLLDTCNSPFDHKFIEVLVFTELM